MPAPFWIHCNICGAFFEKNVRMFFHGCSHTVCVNCMRNSERGTICPLCKKPNKYTEMTKLPDKMKQLFMPNITDHLSYPLKEIEFQRKHQDNLMKLSNHIKLKSQKAVQLRAQIEDEVKKVKADHEKLAGQRKLMQKKLKEIYVKNQQRSIGNYRNPINNSVTSGISSKTSTPTSFFSTPFTVRSGPNFTKSSFGNSTVGFFNKDVPMLAPKSNSFFTGSIVNK